MLLVMFGNYTNTAPANEMIIITSASPNLLLLSGLSGYAMYQLI